ncbi:hypothetical protein B0T20DRAFT_365613, partial [Sordaria brevicollis]
VGPDFDVLPRQSMSPNKCVHRVCVAMSLSRQVHGMNFSEGLCHVMGESDSGIKIGHMVVCTGLIERKKTKWKKGVIRVRLPIMQFTQDDLEPASGQAAAMSSFMSLRSSLSASQEDEPSSLPGLRDDESEGPSQTENSNTNNTNTNSQPPAPSHNPSTTLTFRTTDLEHLLRDPVVHQSFLGMGELMDATMRRARMIELLNQAGVTDFKTPSAGDLDSLPMASSSFGSENATTYTPGPPTDVDNATRFRSFINRINRHQWSSLSEEVHRTITYNKQEISLYQFVEMVKDEFHLRSYAQMEIVTLVGGTGAPEEEEPVAARVKVKHQVVQLPYTAASERKHTEYTRHMFVYFSDDKISEIQDIVDKDEMRRQSSSIEPVPNFRPPPPPSSIDLRQFYEDYIACINGRTMQEDLHHFCKGTVVWNGTEMALNNYSQLMENAFDAISGLEFVPRTVLIDEARQQIAVRIEFAGLPTKPFGGATPNGRRVHFAEHAFYWLEHGKISHVLTIVDWEDYRSQQG